MSVFLDAVGPDLATARYYISRNIVEQLYTPLEIYFIPFLIGSLFVQQSHDLNHYIGTTIPGGAQGEWKT